MFTYIYICVLAFEYKCELKNKYMPEDCNDVRVAHIHRPHIIPTYAATFARKVIHAEEFII